MGIFLGVYSHLLPAQQRSNHNVEHKGYSSVCRLLDILLLYHINGRCQKRRGPMHYHFAIEIMCIKVLILYNNAGFIQIVEYHFQGKWSDRSRVNYIIGFISEHSWKYIWYLFCAIYFAKVWVFIFKAITSVTNCVTIITYYSINWIH